MGAVMVNYMGCLFDESCMHAGRSRIYDDLSCRYIHRQVGMPDLI
jgi:hypothetical protein